MYCMRCDCQLTQFTYKHRHHSDCAYSNCGDTYSQQWCRCCLIDWFTSLLISELWNCDSGWSNTSFSAALSASLLWTEWLDTNEHTTRNDTVMWCNRIKVSAPREWCCRLQASNHTREASEKISKVIAILLIDYPSSIFVLCQSWSVNQLIRSTELTYDRGDYSGATCD